MEKEINKTLLFVFFLIFYFIFLPSISFAANLYFLPSVGTFGVGKTFTVSVYVSSTDQAMNAASGVIIFPTDKLQVTSISKTGSIFDLWVKEPSFSNISGRVSFEGIVLNPGFKGSSGKIISINFLAKSAGKANLALSSASVLANDGKGTNILKEIGSATFTLEYNQIPSTNPNTPPAPEIYSPTHPDPDKWYSNSNPKFVWKITKDITGVGLLVGRKKNASPAVFYSIPISEKQLYNLPDGVWYFHVQLKNRYGWGEISTFKFKIDTQPPDPFKIAVDNEGDPTNPSPIIHFEAKDSLSGIKYYKVKVGNREPVELTNSEYKIPLLDPGEYTIVVEAFDQADNSTAASTTIHIEPLEAPEITEYPSKITTEDHLVIKGTSKYPNSKIIVFIQKDEENALQKETKTDSKGNWVYIYDKKLNKGVYRIWAKVIDNRGAKSKRSNTINILVALPAFIRIGKIAINYLSILVTIIALLIFLILLVMHARYKIETIRERITEKTEKTKKYIGRDFEKLQEEVEKQVSKLDGKKGLSDREREIYEALKKALEESKRKVEKRVDKIDDNIDKIS